MPKQLKSIKKCVRMTQDTYDYIMQFDGSGFNQKFENACKFFAVNDERYRCQLDRLKGDIDDSYKRLCSINRLRARLDDINVYLDYVDDIIQSDMPNLKINK